MDTELTEAFSSQGFELKDKSVIPRVAALLDRHGCTASELAAKYENFVMEKMLDAANLTAKLVDLFQAYLIDEKEREKENKNKKRNTQQWNERMSWDEISELQPAPKSAKKTPQTPGTPAAGQHQQLHSASPLPMSTTPGAFHVRSNAGQVVCSLNQQTAQAGQAQGGTAKLNLELLGSQLRNNHLYMVEHIEDKAHAISERLRDFAVDLEDVVGETPSHQASAPTQEPELVVGRICCDCEGRLNEQSLQLESLVGPRVQLDVSGLPGYRLFPGQVVGVRAVNPTGKKLLAHQLFDHMSKPGWQAADEPGAGHGASSGGWSALVAAGPFTTTDDCTYEPLEALLEHCKVTSPDMLILLGPFVDAEHPLVASGMLDETFQQLFQSQVEARLMQHLDGCPGCKVVLVPAVRDAHHHPTFPQPPLPLRSALSQAVLSAPNPAALRCGDVALGAVTHDVLRHLGAAEATRGAPGDRMAALAATLIGQRSFYPLYPAAPGSCMDLAHHEGLAMPCSPDILLLPSDLAPFAKVVPAARSGSESSPRPVVCINPGRLAKGSAGGTYARIVVAPASAADGIDRRCSVEVVRI